MGTAEARRLTWGRPTGRASDVDGDAQGRCSRVRVLIHIAAASPRGGSWAGVHTPSSRCHYGGISPAIGALNLHSGRPHRSRTDLGAAWCGFLLQHPCYQKYMDSDTDTSDSERPRLLPTRLRCCWGRAGRAKEFQRQSDNAERRRATPSDATPLNPSCRSTRIIKHQLPPIVFV
jgi:hypothetical protein